MAALALVPVISAAVILIGVALWLFLSSLYVSLTGWWERRSAARRK